MLIWWHFACHLGGKGKEGWTCFYTSACGSFTCFWTLFSQRVWFINHFHMPVASLLSWHWAIASGSWLELAPSKALKSRIELADLERAENLSLGATMGSLKSGIGCPMQVLLAWVSKHFRLFHRTQMTLGNVSFLTVCSDLGNSLRLKASDELQLLADVVSTLTAVLRLHEQKIKMWQGS